MPGAVDAVVIDRLMLLYTILTAAFVTFAVLVFIRFPLGEDDHAQRIAKLRETAP